jgi:hypothetical protein
MHYHIEIKDKNEWKIIASFVYESDCKDCQTFLTERYKDCIFRVKEY